MNLNLKMLGLLQLGGDAAIGEADAVCVVGSSRLFIIGQ